MAFTHYYVQAGASDLNAGSTTDAAALFTYAGGTFVRSTGVFTVASGNPLSDGVAVGTYASIYTTAGAVAATFVAQITARDATTITVDVTTLKWGVATTVSETAAAATLKVGGAWASEIVLAATGLGTFTVPVSTKVNIKAATYTIVASRTISMAGTTTAPLWFSGYNTTPGDLDNDTTNALSKPVWSLNATFFITTSGAYQIWSGLSVIGSRSAIVWYASGGPQTITRFRAENTSSNAAAAVIQCDTTTTISYSWFKSPTTATTSSVVTVGSDVWALYGVVTEGGGLSGVGFGSRLGCVFVHCICLNNTGIGFSGTTGRVSMSNCTVYNATGDGVKWSGTPAVGNRVNGCLFDTIGGIGINNASGTNTGNVVRACNDFRACTGGSEAGFGDAPAFFGQTDSSQVVTSSTDMTPQAGRNARAKGFPGTFENQTYSSYPDIGAVQHQDSGGGGLLRHPGLAGNVNG